MTLRAQRTEVVPYDEGWPARFAELAATIRAALGAAALRIDHVGPTAVPGTPARPVIDIQVSVAALEPDSAYRPALEALGYDLLPDDDATQRFFGRRTDNVARVHVRAAGSDGEQRALLVRDHLRAQPDEPGLAAADRWCRDTGWSPPASDA